MLLDSLLNDDGALRALLINEVPDDNSSDYDLNLIIMHAYRAQHEMRIFCRYAKAISVPTINRLFPESSQKLAYLTSY